LYCFAQKILPALWQTPESVSVNEAFNQTQKDQTVFILERFQCLVVPGNHSAYRKSLSTLLWLHEEEKSRHSQGPEGQASKLQKEIDGYSGEADRCSVVMATAVPA
jgi:hypothetical protein